MNGPGISRLLAWLLEVFVLVRAIRLLAMQRLIIKKGATPWDWMRTPFDAIFLFLITKGFHCKYHKSRGVCIFIEAGQRTVSVKPSSLY